MNPTPDPPSTGEAVATLQNSEIVYWKKSTVAAKVTVRVSLPAAVFGRTKTDVLTVGPASTTVAVAAGQVPFRLSEMDDSERRYRN
jgi:hypothetical protein